MANNLSLSDLDLNIIQTKIHQSTTKLPTCTVFLFGRTNWEGCWVDIFGAFHSPHSCIRHLIAQFSRKNSSISAMRRLHRVCACVFMCAGLDKSLSAVFHSAARCTLPSPFAVFTRRCLVFAISSATGLLPIAVYHFRFGIAGSHFFYGSKSFYYRFMPIAGVPLPFTISLAFATTIAIATAFIAISPANRRSNLFPFLWRYHADIEMELHYTRSTGRSIQARRVQNAPKKDTKLHIRPFRPTGPRSHGDRKKK